MSDERPESLNAPQPPSEGPAGITGGKVMVTGGSGFVGRYVVRELIARGYEPVCLVRRPDRLRRSLLPEQAARSHLVRGDLADANSLGQAVEGCSAVIHLVGIILERRLAGQTFERVHVEGTRRVVAAATSAGVRRFVHMSALGSRPEARSKYHLTKWQAEQIVRGSGMDWTIVRPSLIHGPDGEFMQMMKFFSTSRLRQPFMPYFGSGNARIQPVDVRDVAAIFVKALALPESIGKAWDLGGPERFTWKEFYDACALIIRGRRRLKLSVPVGAAKLAAKTIIPLLPSFLVPFKFDAGQVEMSQEDSIADTRPIEEAFGMRLRDFRTELARYADEL